MLNLWASCTAAADPSAPLASGVNGVIEDLHAVGEAVLDARVANLAAQITTMSRAAHARYSCLHRRIPAARRHPHRAFLVSDFEDLLAAVRRAINSAKGDLHYHNHTARQSSLWFTGGFAGARSTSTVHDNEQFRASLAKIKTYWLEAHAVLDKERAAIEQRRETIAQWTDKLGAGLMQHACCAEEGPGQFHTCLTECDECGRFSGNADEGDNHDAECGVFGHLGLYATEPFPGRRSP